MASSVAWSLSLALGPSPGKEVLVGLSKVCTITPIAKCSRRAHHLLGEFGQGPLERLVEPGQHLRELLAECRLQIFRRLGVEASAEAHEVVAALGLSRQPQGGREEGREQLFHGWLPAFLVRVQKPDALAVDGPDAPSEDRLGDLLLGAEMVVRRGDVHARLRRQRTQGHAIDALLAEEPLGSVQDQFLGLLGVRHGFNQTFELILPLGHCRCQARG